MDKDQSEPRSGEGPSSQHLSRILHKLRVVTAGRAHAETKGADQSKGAGGGHIGRYSNLGEIARGGMGIIYRVQDEEMHRTLAMKVLQGDVLDAESEVSEGCSQRTSRFLEEAQVTGQLEHPGIIPVHEMGLDAEGQLFFTMRLVKGSTLGEVIELTHKGDEHWTQARALGVMLKVCEAMAFAHSKNVIHRDLKPANIMVGRFGETYVMDWGLAKVLGAQERTAGEARQSPAPMPSILSTTRAEDSNRGDEASHSTLEGDVLGTPAYMPPEQAHGKLDEMGPVADVYSLGAMLYHLLSGKAPFTQKNGKNGPVEVLLRVMDGPPEPLDVIAPDVPAELLAICQRAMERVPANRYATMLEVAEDLHAFMEQRVVKAYETGSVAEFRKWVRRNKGVAISAAATIIVTLTGLAAVSYTQAQGRQSLAKNNAELARTNEDLAGANIALEAATNLARSNELVAHEQREEALWQSYRANVAAAAVLLDYGSAGEARKRLADCDESQRGWEWRFLEKLTNSSLRTLVGHEEYVRSITYSPDGTWLASGGGGPTGVDRSVRIWDTASGEEVLRIDGHKGDVVSMAFSPGGTELASSSIEGNRTILWEAETGEELLSTNFGGYLAYHPDGRRIAIGSSAGPEVVFWDTYEEGLVRITLPGSGGVGAVRFSADGSRLAAGLTDYKACVIDVESGRVLHTIDTLGGRPEPPPEPQLGNGVLSVDLHPRTGRLLTGLSGGPLLEWDLGSESISTSFDGHRAGVRSARYHPDGPWVVSSDVVTSVRFWHAESGEGIEVLHGHESWTLGLALSPRGDQIASCSLDGTVRLWDGQPGSNVRTYFGEGDRTLRLLAFSPDSRRIAWTPSVERVTISAVKTTESLLALPAFESRIMGMGFDAAGETLLTVDVNGNIRAWDATTGELRDERPASGTTTAAVFDRAGESLALGTVDVEIRIQLFDTSGLGALQSWSLPAEALPPADSQVRVVLQMAFSDDGERLAVLAGLRAVSLWEIATGGLLNAFHVPGGLGGIVYDSDKNEIASTDLFAGSSLKFFDMETGQVLREFGGHAILSSISSFDVLGTRLAVGATDGTVSLWHPEHGEMTTLSGAGNDTGAMSGLRHTIGGVEFSPDSTCLASLTWSGTCRIWDVEPLAERKEERGAAARRRAHARAATVLVERLFEEHLLVAEVVAVLESDPALTPDFLQVATAAARMRADDPERLSRASLRITMQAGRRPVEYVRALAAAELAVRLSPDRPACALALGGAHLRMGNDREAVQALGTRGPRASVGSTIPATIRRAFLAILHQRGGDLKEARAALQPAENALPVMLGRGADELELRTLRALIREAQELVQGE